MDDVKLFQECGAMDLQREIAIGNAIAFQFPHITHMITLNCKGDNLEITFLDPEATYKDEVVKFIKEFVTPHTINT